MAYNIPLADPQKFSTSSENKPLVQDWAFSLPSFSAVYKIGAVAPSAINLDVDIYDITRALDEEEHSFTKFIVKVFSKGQSLSEITGDIEFNKDPSYEIDPQDLTASIQIDFINLQSLLEGVYKEELEFKIFGVLSGGAEIEQIPSATYTITIEVVDLNYVDVTPRQLNFSQIKGTAIPAAQDLTITADGYWRLRHDQNIEITGGDSSFIDDMGYTNIVGNGMDTINVSLSNETESLDPGFYKYTLTVYAAAGEEIQNTIEIIFQLLPIAEIKPVINVENMEFSAVKNLELSKPQSLVASFPGSVEIQSKPSWIDVSVAQQDNILTTEVKPINPGNLSPGRYEGDIVIKNEANETSTVKVLYMVANIVSQNFPTNQVHFTKEEKLLHINHPIQEGLFRIALACRIYDMEQNDVVKNIAFVIPVVNNKGYFAIGLELHRLFKKVLYQFYYNAFINLSQNNQTITYPGPMRVNGVVQQAQNNLDQSGKILESFFIQFIKGHRPKGYTNELMPLSYYNAPQRVTPSGYAMFNFCASILVVLDVFKNGALDHTITLNNQIATKKMFVIRGRRIKFTAFSPGDRVDVRLRSLSPQQPPASFSTVDFMGWTKRFYVFPEGKHSYHIAWINEVNCIELLQLTGDFGFSREYERFQSETTNRFIEKIEQIDIKKGLQVTLNTGWMLKTAHYAIDSLMATENAWLLMDNKIISIVPQNSGIAEIDSDEELYSYDLNFKINPETDAEIYP